MMMVVGDWWKVVDEEGGLGSRFGGKGSEPEGNDGCMGGSGGRLGGWSIYNESQLMGCCSMAKKVVSWVGRSGRQTGRSGW